MENNLPVENNVSPLNPEIKPKLESVSSDRKNLLLIFIFLFLVALFFVLNSKFNFLSKKETPISPVIAQKAIISGTLDLNGPVNSNSLVTILKKETEDSAFVPIIQNFPAKDKESWLWNEAVANKNYEIQAVLYLKGIKIAESNILNVTAPAKDEELRIIVPQEKESSLKGAISGIFDLNGYMPPNSKISVIETPEGKTTESVVFSSQPVDGGVWSWENAEKNASYIIKAVLYDSNNKIIGKSNEIKITAPAQNEILTINSLAKPQGLTPASAGISGKINLNGTVPDKARIVLLQRVAGTSNFIVALDNLNPGDGAVWNWQGASSGVSYELLAVLKVKNSNGTDKDIANSQSLIVTAPAKNELITINTGIVMGTPGLPVVTCDNQNNNQWNITLKGSRQIDASSYWFQIGTQSGGNDITNTTISQSDNDPQLKATINNNTTYYARYSYAYCSNCSINNYSTFSNTLTFTCPQSPTPQPTSAYTGYICDPVNGCQATQIANPPYAFNNAGLSQCQLVCNKPTPTSVPTLTPTQTPSPTLTPTPTPTDVPPTNTPIPTDTPVLPQ